MTSWELEARGAEELRNQVQASLARQAERPKLDVQMAHAGQPVPLDGMTAYVAQVEFADGKLWIPSRATLADPKLARVAAPSPEEQRLTELYRKKGLNALVEELKRFQ